MLLINELIKLRHRLLNTSSLSLKEKAFYQFLVGEPLNHPTGNNLAEIEQICLAVFSGDLLSKKELITTQRKKQPIHGMHYTKNLIELSAMARDNVEVERKNLKSYCENHSTRDSYILNCLFPDILSNPPLPQGAVDEIAMHLYKGESPQEGWESLLLKALYETSDLIDFYVIEQGYLQGMYDNPIVHKIEAIRYIRDILIDAEEKSERRVKFTIAGVGTLLLLLMSYWLIPLIIKSWETAEPLIAILETLPLFLIGLFAFAGYTPDKIRFFNLIRKKIIDWVFRWNGLDRKELRENLDRLK